MRSAALGVDADNPHGALAPVRGVRLRGARALHGVAQAAWTVVVRRLIAAASRRCGIRPPSGYGRVPPAIVERCASRTRRARPMGSSERETVDEMAAWLGHPSEQFDAARDVDGRRARRPDGRRTPARTGSTPMTAAARAPAVGRGRSGTAARGIGGAAARQRAARRARWPPSLPTDRATVAALRRRPQRRGRAARALARYEPVRWFFDMERPGLDGDLPEPAAARRASRCDRSTRRAVRAIWRAEQRGLPRPLGRSDDSEARCSATSTRPDFDTSLWVVAWDGDEVAGGIINTHLRGGERGARPASAAGSTGLHASRVAQAWAGSALIGRQPARCSPSAG